MSLPNVWSRVQVFLPAGGKVPSMKRFLCGLVILGLSLGAVGQARPDFIYWSDISSGDIWRANLDGSGMTNLVSGLDHPLGPALDLAGGQMYWGNNGAGD